MNTKFTYFGNLLSLNEYIKIERGNKFAAATKKNALTHKVAFTAMSQIKEPLFGQFDLKITWFVADNKTDSDNIFFGVKFLLDGLVLAKKILGDGRKHIRNISNVIITDSKLRENIAEIEFISTK